MKQEVYKSGNPETTKPRELEFWGEGKAADIERGFAIVSLRNPRSEYNFYR